MLKNNLQETIENKKYPVEKCVWCGKSFLEHAHYHKPKDIIPRMPCLGLREKFVAKV